MKKKYLKKAQDPENVQNDDRRPLERNYGRN
jgi:hypothetical protein